jgi:hypothetical protein
MPFPIIPFIYYSNEGGSESYFHEFIGLNGKFVRFRRDGPFLKRFVTCDEKWIFYDNVIRKRQWCRPGEAPKPTPNKNLRSIKLMICVWWDMEGIITSSYDPTKP